MGAFSKTLKYSIIMEEKVHEYSDGELTILWKPQRCTHSGVCVKTLPAVYHPQERPWINMENATTAELISQINKCPSGALSYRIEENIEIK